MAKVIVIGGSGHIGTYLIPALVEQGHKVVNVSRGQAKSYQNHSAWNAVEQIKVDRAEAEKKGTFGSLIADLNPDIVVDLISFNLENTKSLVEALRGKVDHFLHCSTIWVYGHNVAVPADESDPLNPFGEYGIEKAKIETWLLHEARRNGFPATIFRPGQIVGPGYAPITPAGNVNIELYRQMAKGEEITLPNFGLETLHHVHAEDVAQVVTRAIKNRAASVGEVFNAVSRNALNLRGYAELMFRWFGHEPKIRYLPFDDWKKEQTPEFAHHSWEHISRSSCLSMEKARQRLGYEPRYSAFEAIQESILAMIEAGEIPAPKSWQS